MIFPAVCSAITRLISFRATSGARAKSAPANVAAASLSRAVNSGRTGRPDWTQTVSGARNVTDPDAASPMRADSERSPSTAASADPFRCRARASSAAVWPRAPHQASHSALATLTGEKTMSAPSCASRW